MPSLLPRSLADNRETNIIGSRREVTAQVLQAPSARLRSPRDEVIRSNTEGGVQTKSTTRKLGCRSPSCVKKDLAVGECSLD